MTRQELYAMLIGFNLAWGISHPGWHGLAAFAAAFCFWMSYRVYTDDRHRD
jgi:hypothetical protein